jgi:hypothetical protein
MKLFVYGRFGLGRNDSVGRTLDGRRGKTSKSKDPNAKEMTKSQWLKNFVQSLLVRNGSDNPKLASAWL